MGPFESMTSRRVFSPPLSWFPTTPNNHPYVSTCGIGKKQNGQFSEQARRVHPLNLYNYRSCLDCMMPGVQVTTGLGFFLHLII